MKTSCSHSWNEIPLAQHPLRCQVLGQLRRNVALHNLSEAEWGDLEKILSVVEIAKDEALLTQGCSEMGQFFILEGLLKRVVTNKQGKEMTLRFAGEGAFETCYAAWSLGTRAPYSIMALSKATVAKCSMPVWKQFLDDHPAIKHDFEYQVMSHMSDIMAHTITLHLLDAAGRMARFQRKHPELIELLSKKELAQYLNIAPETLSRLLHHPND
ncbi:MAG: Crp/Fnr family transcriptional regulator [Betaproteobacteria bacterium]|nr:Crp/Fnr family transcriptional regulator [Betaproteobacteria bacterium]MDE2622471.1 Crp/Fnr family transcriptional regulator [Betaproteobacteria bacterium]